MATIRALGALALASAVVLLASTPAAAAPPGFVEYAPPNPGAFRGYLGIVDGRDGFLYFTQENNDAIGQLDPRTGAFRESIIPTQFGRPDGITVGPGPDRKIWFTETGAGKIGRLDDPVTGQITEFPLTSVYGQIQSQPRPITTGPDGNLWFVQIGPQIANSSFPSYVGRMTPAGGHDEFLVPSLSAFSLDEGITVGPDNNIWFTESNVRKVGRLNPQNPSVVEEFPLGSAGAPLSITKGPDNNLWVGTNNGLARINTAGVVTHHDPLPQAQGNNEVFGIATGADGHVWFTLGFALGLGRINPGNLQVELFPIGSFQLDRFPYGITAGPDGNIWYADLNANRIGQASLLSILPAPGTFVTAQSIDVLVVNHAAGRVATGGQMRLTTLDPTPTAPLDVTADYLGCLVSGAGFGTLTAGGQTFRCGSVPLSLALLGPGRHLVEVDLTLNDGSQLRQAVVWNVLASAEPGPGPGPVVSPPELIVAPPAGQLATTQLVDFVVAVKGGGRTIPGPGSRVLLDGNDVTAGVGACPSSPTGLVPGSLLDGGVTFRCPRIPAEVLTPGPHLLDVRVVLDDGAILQRTVEYIAVLNTEP